MALLLKDKRSQEQYHAMIQMVSRNWTNGFTVLKRQCGKLGQVCEGSGQPQNPGASNGTMHPCSFVRTAIISAGSEELLCSKIEGGRIYRDQLVLPVPLHVWHMPLPTHFGHILEVCPLPLTSPEITAIGVGMCCKMVPVPLHLRHFPDPWQPEHRVVSLSLIDLSPPIEG